MLFFPSEVMINCWGVKAFIVITGKLTLRSHHFVYQLSLQFCNNPSPHLKKKLFRDSKIDEKQMISAEISLSRETDWKERFDPETYLYLRHDIRWPHTRCWNNSGALHHHDKLSLAAETPRIRQAFKVLCEKSCWFFIRLLPKYWMTDLSCINTLTIVLTKHC